MPKESALRLGNRLLLTLAMIPLVGCSISVRQPTDGSKVILTPATSPVHVVVTGNASYNNLMVAIDGTNVTPMMVSKAGNEDDGDIPLTVGTHTLVANADVHCWYCSGQTSHSTATSTFQVDVVHHK